MVFEAFNITLITEQLDLLLKQNPWILPALIAVQIWKLIWYGIAIYQAAFVRKQKAWFIALLICAFFLNDLGLLAILYLVLSKPQNKELTKKNSRKKQ